MIDLDKLDKEIDELFEQETSDSLTKWLLNRRLGDFTKLICKVKNRLFFLTNRKLSLILRIIFYQLVQQIERLHNGCRQSTKIKVSWC
jgi:hypothetical protein